MPAIGRTAAAMFAVLVVGCATPPTTEPVEFTSLPFLTDQMVYGPDDVIRVTLTNDSDGILYYNLCSATLEIRGGQEWTEVERQLPPTACVLGRARLLPEQETVEHQDVQEWMAPGIYRFRVEVESEILGRVVLVTPTFELRE